MNIALWAIQGLLAFHTAAGGIWKFSNSEQSVPSLATLPHGAWLALAVVELLAAAALILPLMNRSAAFLVPLAAGFVAAEMLLFSALHLASGERQHGEMIYWLVVAAVCGALIFGRLVLRPL